MLKKLLLAIGLLAPFAGAAQAQTALPIATVVDTCGNAAYLAGRNAPLTVDTTGTLCLNGGGGGSGTVTSIAAGAGITLTPDPITTTGTVALTTPVAVANGGTGLTSGTSGGILGFTASGTIASSAALGAGQVVTGGGAGATPGSSATFTSNGTGQITAQGLTTTSPGFYSQLTGDANARISLGLNASDVARIGMGDGTAARDTFLTRTSTGGFTMTGPANTPLLTGTGYSLTGSNASAMLDLAGTLNTSGSPIGLKIAWSNTTSGANTKFASFLAGASGTTEVFSVDKAGAVVMASTGLATELHTTNLSANSAGSHIMGSGVVRLNDGGANSYLSPTSTRLPSTAAFGWVATTDGNGQSLDLSLFRDAANTLAQRNGTNAQALRVYNTYTDASNYERQSIYWLTNVARWESAAAGTGTARNMEIVRGSTTHWAFTSAGNTFGANILAGTDNTYDIGASGATRPRTIYAGTDVIAGAGIYAGASQYIGMNTRSLISSPSNGVLLLTNFAVSDFSRLQFGGTTSSFPALKRNSTTLEAKLADDSAYTLFTAARTQTVTSYSAAGTPLPTCNAGAFGTRAMVADATTPTFLGTYVSGGAVTSPVTCDGTNWVTGANDNLPADAIDLRRPA